MSPPPPLRHYATPTLPPPKVTEDTPPDLLEGDMDLTVILPAGHRVNMSVARSTPMMDLLIQVTTAHKINPGGHIIHLVSDNRLLTYKPSTPIGTLDTSVIKIVAKNRLNEEARARRAHLVSQAQEKNIRLKPKEYVFKQQLVVNLPRNQLAVYRVPPRTLISEVLAMVCHDRGIDADTHEIRHPVNVDEKLRGSCTLSDYQLQEVSVVPRDYQPPPLSVTDLITMAAITSTSREQVDSKRRGLLSLFSRRPKSSAGESSLSSGSAGERSVSPARSDGSVEGGGGGQHPTSLTAASSTTTITPATTTTTSTAPPPRPRKRQAPPPPPPGAEHNGKEPLRGGGGGGGGGRAAVPLSRCSSDSSSGYHESMRSAHTSPAESEVSEVTQRQPLTSLTNLTSTSSTSSLSLISRGKRRAPPPPKPLQNPPVPIPEERETPPTPTQIASLPPTTSTPIKASPPPSPSPSSSSSSSSSASSSSSFSEGRKTTSGIPPPPDVDAPPLPPIPPSSSSSASSSSAPSEHEVQLRRASFSSESSEEKSGQGDGDEHSSDDSDSSSSVHENQDLEEEAKPAIEFESRQELEEEDDEEEEEEEDEEEEEEGLRRRDPSPSTSSSSSESSEEEEEKEEEEEEKEDIRPGNETIPWDFALPDPPTPFQDDPNSPRSSRESTTPPRSMPVPDDASNTKEIKKSMPDVTVPEIDNIQKQDHRRRRRRRRRLDSSSSTSSSDSSIPPSTAEKGAKDIGEEEMKKNVMNELKTAIRDVRTEPRIIEMKPKSTVVYHSQASVGSTAPVTVSTGPVPVSSFPISKQHREKTRESTSTYESCDEAPRRHGSRSSSATSYDSAPPPLPDTAPPPPASTPASAPATTPATAPQESTKGVAKSRGHFRPPQVNFSISTYTSRSEETSYEKKLVKSDSQDSTATADSTAASTTVPTMPTTTAPTPAKPILPEKPFFKEFSSTARVSNAPARWIPRVGEGERRPPTFRQPAAPRRIQRGGSQLGRANSLGNLSVLEQDLRRAQSSTDLSTGNGGPPVDMQGGGGGNNTGGGGAPFFPMGGGMMMGDAGLADEFMKLQQDFFKWQQQLLQNQHVLHSRVAPLASNPPQLQSVGVIRDILGQTPQQGPLNGPPPHQQMAEAHNPSVGMGMSMGGRRAPVERIINIRFEDGPSETDEAELHGPAFSRVGPVYDLTRDMGQMGMQAPRPQPQLQPQPQPQRRWEEPNVTVGAWRDRPTMQPTQEPPTFPPMPSPTPLTPTTPLQQPVPQQRTSPRPQGPRGYTRPAEGGLQWPPPSSAQPSTPEQQYQALPPEQKQQFAQFMQQQRQQPTWPPQPQQTQSFQPQPQPIPEQQKQMFIQPQQQTWPPKQPSPQPQMVQQAPQPSQQQTWPPKQPSPQPQLVQQSTQPLQQQTWSPKQPSPPKQTQQVQQPTQPPQPSQQATWPPKQPSPQPGTARQPQPQQPDSQAFWRELEDKRQGLGLREEEEEEEQSGNEPARPPRRGSRQDSPPQDASRPQYFYNGEQSTSAPPAGANTGPRYTSVVTVAADQAQEPSRDKVRSVVQLNAEQQPVQPQGQRTAPVVRGFRQPHEEGVQSRIIANQAASRSRSSVSPPSATNGMEGHPAGRIVPSTASTASTTPPRASPTQGYPTAQHRPVQNRVSPPSEAPQAAPPAGAPPPPPPPAPPMAPPPPPAPVMPQGERRTSSGKKIVTCKGGPELDAREELMMAIRGHGGLKSLRKTHPPC